MNLGYGSITDGWDSGPANVATPFELFPNDLDFSHVLTALGSGTQQGIQDFVKDLGSLATSESVSSAPNLVDTSLPSLTDVVNAISSAASSAYATLAPTADLVNAFLTSAPAYIADVFSGELAEGNLVDAIGLPIAGLFGLGSVALGYEYVIEGAMSAITADFQSLIP